MEESYNRELDLVLNEISELKKEFIDCSTEILKAGNSSLYLLDFLVSAIMNRAISLINAYVCLAKDNNYLSAVPLIRLQVDNVLSFYASMLVKDSGNFARHFLDGKDIKDYKSFEGKNLSNNYLAKKIDETFPGILKLYRDTCAFIHLSNKYFSPIAQIKKGTKRTIEVRIGSYDVYSGDEKLKFSRSMLEVSKALIIIVRQWGIEKDRLVALPEDEKSKYGRVL
ncbi:hypothetical protein D0T50_02405 [Bacteroides sp. 214]|uniref:hypothetical protein n=1 Tax=Bacteroides sp. 214 TaxID=2302935 RepID=UPI0013D07BE5|nr:hypothetical protein [Bacteroides sp. 214]NDW11739.1 hypothetical protein [Bacteroides sp. 214]